ncbi:hypothetical protein [Senegalia massiliensis]|uniref:hypothetical protein n=1 Tax=Senegalia massiliensis TaxID=1720316 RepID=UPI001031EE25|nr:hypothetical protein [Senegalia massiliensis]
MSIIIEQFKNHQIHESLNSLEEIIKKAEEKKDIPEANLEHITRLKLVKERLVNDLEAVDPYFVSKNTLDNIYSNINSATQNLNSYISNLNQGHVNNIIANTNNIIHIMSLINNIKSPDDIENIRNDISNFRKSISHLMNNMHKDYNEYSEKLKDEYNKSVQTINERESKLEQITESISAEKSRVNSVISQSQNQINEFNTQFSKSQENRIEEFSNLKDKFKEDFSDLEHNINEDFERVSDEFNSNFKEIEKSNKEIFFTLINELKDTRIKIEEEYDSKVKEYFKQFDEYKDELKKLSNSVAIKNMSEGYDKFANKEKSSRIIWQITTVLSIIGLIGFSINFVNSFKNLNLPTNEVNWALFSSRIIVVSAIGTLTAYCSRQASKHLENERYNRQMQLELSAIKPYLAILPNERKDEIMEELAYKFFGRYDVIFSNDDKRDDEDESKYTMLLDLLQRAFNMNNKVD